MSGQDETTKGVSSESKKEIFLGASWALIILLG